MQPFIHSAKQRYLAYLGLFAVLMLTIGPVTSQILAMVSFASHSSTNQLHQTAHHTNLHAASTNTQQHTVQVKEPSSHHSMNLCGYCELLHNPVIPTYIILVVKLPPIGQQILSFHLDDIFSPPHLSPPSQAPPTLS